MPVRGADEADLGADDGRSPDEIEQAIRERQEHLAGTLDELSRRLEPARLARVTADEARTSARSALYDARGSLRVERVVAIAAAAVVVVVVWVVAQVRTRRRRRKGRDLAVLTELRHPGDRE